MNSVYKHNNKVNNRQRIEFCFSYIYFYVRENISFAWNLMYIKIGAEKKDL